MQIVISARTRPHTAAQPCGELWLWQHLHRKITGPAAAFQSVVATGAGPERPRVGMLVANVPLCNPALLAREIATADILILLLLIGGLGRPRAADGRPGR
jgi:hypothetical protein